MLLLRFTAEYDDGEYCDNFSGIKHEIVDETTLLKEMSDYTLSAYGFVRLTVDEKKKPNQIAIDTLKKHGWFHLNSVKDRTERKAMEQKFYILNEKGIAYSSYCPKFGEIDLSNLTDETLKQLADGAEVVQKVSMKSVLSDKDYKRYLAFKKKKDDAAKKLKTARAAKLEKKKKKEIEKAKKLLEEAGELDTKT